MSAAAHVTSASSPRRAFASTALLTLVICFWLPVLSFLVVGDWNRIGHDGLRLGAWTLLLLAAYLLPLRSRDEELFAADFPVMTAVAMLFTPTETALIAFAGSIDLGELRGRPSLLKVAFNHTQISGTWFVGSWVIHALAPVPSLSAIAFPVALVGLLVACILNYVLVGIPHSLQLGYPLRKTLARLKIGSLSDFGLALIAGGSMGALLALAYRVVGDAVLPFFLVPVLLTRQALLKSQKFVELDRAYRDREVALARMADQVDRERTDERRLIAADLHDEVLQPLFSVSLLGQTIRNDLATGRLLEMEDDLPKLITATERASETIRGLVGDLRKSGLGRGGLTSTLRRLAAVLQEQTKVRLHARIDDVTADPAVQLAIYQIAKEALGNVLRHAKATDAWLELTTDDDVLSLFVRDDGVGFEPTQAPEEHYGLLIMKERAASVGGSLYIDTATGEGCSLRAVIPWRR